MRCLLESSVALGGSRSLFGVPFRAESAAANSRSLLRSRAGLVGGISAVPMASSPFAVLNVPATTLREAAGFGWLVTMHDKGEADHRPMGPQSRRATDGL
jgi:hypothetical protein